MVEDFKTKVRSSSKKKRISHINNVLRLGIWLCLAISSTLIVLFAIAYISSSDVFLTKQIEIKGCNHVEIDEILPLLDLEEGDNILSWDITNARQRMLGNPWVKDVSISRSFIPSSVEIQINEHFPAATLEFNDKRYLISKNGKVFAPAPEQTLGFIIQAPDYSPTDARQELNDILKKAIDAVKIIETKGLATEHVTIGSGGRMKILLQNGISLVFLGELTPVKIHMALRTLNEIKPQQGTTMYLTCEDKIILRARGSHGS